MSKIDKKLEEILIDPKSPNRALCCSWEQIAQLKSLFAEFGEELIGQDVISFTDRFGFHNVTNDHIDSQNQLRAEKRQKLKALLGEVKE